MSLEVAQALLLFFSSFLVSLIYFRTPLFKKIEMEARKSRLSWFGALYIHNLIFAISVVVYIALDKPLLQTVFQFRTTELGIPFDLTTKLVAYVLGIMISFIVYRKMNVYEKQIKEVSEH